MRGVIPCAWAVALLLAGCSWLPRAGPTGSEVEAQAATGDRVSFDLVKIDDAVIDGAPHRGVDRFDDRLVVHAGNAGHCARDRDGALDVGRARPVTAQLDLPFARVDFEAVAARSELGEQRGRYTRAVTFRSAGARVAIDATLRALASLEGRLAPVNPQALRYKLLKHKQGTLFVFAIDASGSMAANRIARAKSTILKLLRKSYLNRDSVAIVSFHGTSANVDLPPSRSILRARRVLDSLRMGGSTPLGLGLVTTIELLELVGNKFGERVVLLFTDGRSNVPLRFTRFFGRQRERTA